jgi:prenylcysteine alpha-carboxyl methylesterase
MNIARLLCWTVPIFLWNGFRLFLFVVALAPGFVCFAWYYFVTADRVSVRYGQDSIRQSLDVYRPNKISSRVSGEHIVGDISDDQTEQCLLPSPVLVFYTGGGWMIGYKMWGSLLARALTAAGIVVVIPDMRNFPIATVQGMVHDVDASLEWTMKHIGEFGGDPTKVVVVGQSAGGHVSFMAVLEKLRAMRPNHEPLMTADAMEGQNGDCQEPLLLPTASAAWKPSDLKGIVSISTPFHLKAMSDSFQKKGLDDHLVDRIFGFECDKYDPFAVLEEFHGSQEGRQLLLENLPPIRIYHGTADKTVPHEDSKAFYQELKKTIEDEQQLAFVSYPGWSHTDPILEGPMDADQSLHRDLFHDMRKWTGSTYLSWPSEDKVIKHRLCPHFMIQAGRFFNPF